MDLQRLPRRTDEIAQNSNVGAVSTDASGIHKQAETLGKVEIHACVVQLRQAETLRWQDTIYPCRIDRPRRAVASPRAPRQLVKLPPIAVVASRHFDLNCGPVRITLSRSTFASIL